MNVVLDDAEEVWMPKAATEKRPAIEMKRKPLGPLHLLHGLCLRRSTTQLTLAHSCRRPTVAQGRKHHVSVPCFGMSMRDCVCMDLKRDERR